MSIIRYILPILFLFISIIDINAQSSNNYILSPVSFLFEESLAVDLIASEPINVSNYAGSSKITQGFLQPESFLYLNVDNQEANFCLIYPNPASNGIFIEFKRECGKEIVCSIFNVMGQEIQSYNLKLGFEKKIYLDLKDLHKGIYFISFNDLQSNVINTIKTVKN